MANGSRGGSSNPGMISRSRTFAGECWGELRKVQWPTWAHVVQGTLVVLLVAVVMALYLTLADQIAVQIITFVNDLG